MDTSYLLYFDTLRFSGSLSTNRATSKHSPGLQECAVMLVHDKKAARASFVFSLLAATRRLQACNHHRLTAPPFSRQIITSTSPPSVPASGLNCGQKVIWLIDSHGSRAHVGSFFSLSALVFPLYSVQLASTPLHSSYLTSCLGFLTRLTDTSYYQDAHAQVCPTWP